jgi:hypothetical protein
MTYENRIPGCSGYESFLTFRQVLSRLFVEDFQPFNCPLQGLWRRVNVPLTYRYTRMAHETHYSEGVHSCFAESRPVSMTQRV